MKLREFNRLYLSAAVGAVAMSLSMPAHAMGRDAPTAAPADEAAAAADATESIVVTGTRVKRDGYSAPTPETVLSAEALQSGAPVNIADAVNDLPALAASNTPRQNTINVSGGSAGSNFLNLRGLGANRTLILLDGRRVVGASAEGTVDANTLPSTLVSRVDVVTGGASAAYGSDAVSGVVNFVLDTKFTGVKLSALSGITTYGDDHKWRVDLAAGTPFADGRGHALFGATYSSSEGILETASRPWFKSQKQVVNPVTGAGQPRLINADNVNLNSSAPTGIITNGALIWTEFTSPTSYRLHDVGTRTSGGVSIGGDPSDLASIYALDIPIKQWSAFGRLNFKFSDAAELYAEGTYANAVARPGSPPSFGSLTLSRDNAFLAPELKARLVTANQTTFTLGTWHPDVGRLRPRNERELMRVVLGLKGDLGSGWSYDLYGQYGRTDFSIDAAPNTIKANLAKAADAVFNSANQIVCAVNRTTVTDAACLPYNPFGSGQNSAATIAYISGDSWLRQRLEQTVVAGSVQGEPFSTWAGPVSVVVGGEYRQEKITGTSDAISQVSGFNAGNYRPTVGKYQVTEAFAETVVPLAKDVPFFQQVDLNAAVRRTHYSTSGSVTTWKVGLNWSPVSDIRFRATRSRDIRAPNLSELYQGGVTSTQQQVTDSVTNVVYTGITAITTGNPNLKPERADSLTIGAVAQPSFLPGFSASVDYFNIKIADAITTLLTQATYDRCQAGNQLICSDITRNTAGAPTQIIRRPVNLNSERARGLDIEASYRVNLSDLGSGLGGNVTFRVLATHMFSRSIDDGITLREFVGENTGTVPKWRFVSSVAYDSDKIRASLTARSVSGGVYDNRFTAADIADNHIAGATYFDLALGFKFKTSSLNGEFFVNADNLFNKAPVIVYGGTLAAPVNAQLYDTLGRELRAGVRLKF